MMSVYIGIPCFRGDISSETCTTLLNLRESIQTPLQVKYIHAVDIRNARAALLTDWYDNYRSFDYCLMIDDDMVFESSLISAMLAFDKSVTGAIYSVRALPPRNDFWRVATGSPLEDAQPIVGGFQQWEYVGGGILLIKRHVVGSLLSQQLISQKAASPGLPFKISRLIDAFEPVRTTDGGALSEDHSFCARWRKGGGEIWAAVGWRVGHVGRHVFWLHAKNDLKLGA